MPSGVKQRHLAGDRARDRIEQLDDRPRDVVGSGGEPHRHARGDALVQPREAVRPQPLFEPPRPDIAGASTRARLFVMVISAPLDAA